MKSLKLVLRLNAASCLIFGLIFAIWSDGVSQFIGTEQNLIIMLLGIGLVFNGLHLSFASMRKTPLKLEVYWFSMGDILWFSATIILVASEFFITANIGMWASLIIAFGVLTLGLAQLWFYAELHNLGINGQYMMPANLSRLNAIKTSWLGMKTWVKIWLFGLNAVFIVALLFLPLDVAKYTLAGFVISGPLLMALMIVQRGLTRLLGIAHLIPWLPLLAYILFRLLTDINSSQSPYIFTYLSVLAGIMSICLVLDVADVYRWFQGDKYRLGVQKSA